MLSFKAFDSEQVLCHADGISFLLPQKEAQAMLDQLNHSIITQHAIINALENSAFALQAAIDEVSAKQTALEQARSKLHACFKLPAVKPSHEKQSLADFGKACLKRFRGI